MEYIIYQVKPYLTRNYAFMSLSIMEKLKINIDLENYNQVYKGELENGSEQNVESLLESIYITFNNNIPTDFTGRSLSVSDILFMDNEYYYCDSFGWEKLNINNISNLKGALLS